MPILASPVNLDSELWNHTFTGFDVQPAKMEPIPAAQPLSPAPAPMPQKPPPQPAIEKWNYRFKDQRAGAAPLNLGLYHAYHTRPADADDLTRLKGVDSGAVSKLNALGIYKNEQLRELSDDQLRRLAGHLGIPEPTALLWKQVPSPGESVTPADSLPAWPRVPTEAEIGERASQLARWRQENGVAGSQEDDWILAERELFVQACGHGVKIDRKASYSSGTRRDAFPGVPPRVADELSRLGYPKPSSLAAINPADRCQVERWLKARGMESDIHSLGTPATQHSSTPTPQHPNMVAPSLTDSGTADDLTAIELAPSSRCLNAGAAQVRAEDLDRIIMDEFAGEDVEIRPPFGIVYKTPPAIQDNLQDIYGVGPILEKRLHAFGVYRFKQIANWTNEAIEEFQEELSFPDRIRRDDWVGQCIRFLREGSSGKNRQKS